MQLIVNLDRGVGDDAFQLRAERFILIVCRVDQQLDGRPLSEPRQKLALGQVEDRAVEPRHQCSGELMGRVDRITRQTDDPEGFAAERYFFAVVKVTELQPVSAVVGYAVQCRRIVDYRPGLIFADSFPAKLNFIKAFVGQRDNHRLCLAAECLAQHPAHAEQRALAAHFSEFAQLSIRKAELFQPDPHLMALRDISEPLDSAHKTVRQADSAVDPR